MFGFESNQIWIVGGVAVLAFILGRITRGGTMVEKSPSGGGDGGGPALSYDDASPEAQREIDTLIMAHKKIEAIKLFREATGSGLKEAKDAVEFRAHNIGAG